MKILSKVESPYSHFKIHSIRVSIVVIVLLVFQACPKDVYDYVYDIQIANNTNDTLEIIIGSINTNISTESGWSQIINPLDTVSFLGTIDVISGEDVVRNMLSVSPLWDTVHIFRHDSLKVAWYFPARDDPENIHDFFNYNSWENWLIDDDEGIVMFTILKSDFHSN